MNADTAAGRELASFPFRGRGWAPPDVEAVRTDDGGWIVRNRTPLPEGRFLLPALFLANARRHPERPLFAQRPAEGAEWQVLTWGGAVDRVARVAAGLGERGLGRERPVAVLSEPSIDHGVLLHACLLAGVPCASVSAPYSLLPGARSKLLHVLETVRPGLVYVEDLETFEPALEVLRLAGLLDGVILVSRTGGSFAGRDVLASADLHGQVGDVDDGAAALVDRLTPDTHARYLFTSGSTGMPKGVIFTHAMFEGVVRFAKALRPAEHEHRVYLDWMPWSHAGAGFGRFAQVTYSGASLYLDDGRPTPDRFHRTIENIKDVRPTHYVGAPVMWNMLAQAMEEDEELRRAFFSRISECQYGSAAMAQSTYERVLRLSVRELGEKIVMGTGYGATESMMICSSWWPVERVGHMGVPVPGTIVKLAPAEGKLEVRVKSAMVTPGYLHRDDLTAAAFDEEGWYRTGDAARWLDETDPDAGLVFDGRLAEQFKLVTGTWVAAGTLRLQVISACAPLVRDVVVCGLDRAEVGVLVWPNIAACRALAGTASPLETDERVLDAVQRGIERHNASNPSSSTRVGRFLLLAEPPSMEHHELTEKGYVNQAAARAHRAEDIDRLFATAPEVGVRLL